MTNIVYNTENNGFFLEAKGHSGFAAYGKDIVCAAISVLLQTLVEELKKSSPYLNYSMRDGYVFIHASGPNTPIIFDTILTGLELIEDCYPEHIKIKNGCTFQNDFGMK